MNLEPKAEIKTATRVSGGPATPRKGPPKFKQRQTRQFKSKPPKKGIQGYAVDDAHCFLSFIFLRNNRKWWFVIPLPLQLWWRYPWYGGLRHRWVQWGALHVSSGLQRPEWPHIFAFPLQTSPSFAPGRPSITWSCMSWPSTASSEPSTSPCNPLRITGHVHALQTICLRLRHLALNGTLPDKLPLQPVTNTKNGKTEKRSTKKKETFCPLSLDSSSDSALHTQLLLTFRIL